jgi:hypothetical protein
LPATLVCILYFSVYYWADSLYTEIPFSLATLLFVLCNRNGSRTAYDVGAGVLAAAAYLLRTSGIALLVAWVAESLLRGRYRQMFFRAGMALIPVILWQAHIERVQNSQQYRHPVYEYQRAPYQYSNVTYAENVSLIDPFKPELGRANAIEMLRRFGRNLVAMPQALGEPVSAPASFWQAHLATFLSLIGSQRLAPQWLVAIPVTLIGCFVISGMVLLWARRERFIPLYVSSYVFVVCMTPWPEQFPRYLMPLSPLLTLSLFYVLAWVAEWRRKQDRVRYRKAGLALTVLLPAVIFFVQGLTLTHAYTRGRRPVSYYDVNGNEMRYTLFYYDQRWEPVNTALEWLRRRGQTDEVIAATAPHATYLRTGMKAVLPPLEAESERAQRLLDSARVKYVVLDILGIPGISERYAAPAIEKHPQLWKLIYTAPNGGAHIYERVE